MARPRYRITASDLAYAWRWIESKLANPGWLGETRSLKASEAFEHLAPHDSEALNEWCETWLDSRQWRQMKNAIRAARMRERRNDLVNVTLSRYAVSILEFWARRDGCTYSEVIERRLGGKTQAAAGFNASRSEAGAEAPGA